MRQGNKNTRDKAIPFESIPVDGAFVLPDASFVNNDTPIYDPAASPWLTKAVLMTRPDKGDIVEAQLFMQMTAPSDRALEVRIGIGRLVESGGDPTFVAETHYSDVFIKGQHTLITGLDTPFSAAANGQLTIEANLLPALLRDGADNFSRDMFVLLVTFNPGIASANGYSLDKFKITASAQIGLGR